MASSNGPPECQIAPACAQDCTPWVQGAEPLQATPPLGARPHGEASLALLRGSSPSLLACWLPGWRQGWLPAQAPVLAPETAQTAAAVVSLPERALSGTRWSSAVKSRALRPLKLMGSKVRCTSSCHAVRVGLDKHTHRNAEGQQLAYEGMPAETYLALVAPGSSCSRLPQALHCTDTWSAMHIRIELSHWPADAVCLQEEG